jgi:hypothetical protein
MLTGETGFETYSNAHHLYTCAVGLPAIENGAQNATCFQKLPTEVECDENEKYVYKLYSSMLSY